MGQIALHLGKGLTVHLHRSSLPSVSGHAYQIRGIEHYEPDYAH